MINFCQTLYLDKIYYNNLVHFSFPSKGQSNYFRLSFSILPKLFSVESINFTMALIWPLLKSMLSFMCYTFFHLQFSFLWLLFLHIWFSEVKVKTMTFIKMFPFSVNVLTITTFIGQSSSWYFYFMLVQPWHLTSVLILLFSH